MDMSWSKLLGTVKNREAWCAADHGVVKCWTQLSNWATTPPNPFLRRKSLNYLLKNGHLCQGKEKQEGCFLERLEKRPQWKVQMYVIHQVLFLQCSVIFALGSRVSAFVHLLEKVLLLLLLLSRFSRVQLCAIPETAAHQAPPSLEFSRQEHWSGLPFPSPVHQSEKWTWSCSVMSDS